MLGRSAYSPAISANLGEIEHRLRSLERRLEGAGRHASARAVETADNVGEAVASALGAVANRFRAGAASIGGAAEIGNEAAKLGSDALRRLSREVERRPLVTLGVAVGVGILVGLAGTRSRSGTHDVRPKRHARRHSPLTKIAGPAAREISAARRKKVSAASPATPKPRRMGSSTRRPERSRTCMDRQRSPPRMPPRPCAEAPRTPRTSSAIPSSNALTPRHSSRFASAGSSVAWGDAIERWRATHCIYKEVTVTIGTILLIVLIIILLGGFSGLGGGPFYGTGYYGGGGLGLVIVILLILVLLGRI